MSRGRPGAVLAGCALLAAAGLSVPAAGSAQAHDTITIRLAAEGIFVRQRLEPTEGEVHAIAMRFGGQELDVVEVVREGESLLDAELDIESSAYGFRVESGAPVVLEYAVAGDAERVPLFVARGAAELTVAEGVEAPHLVRVVGDSARLDEIDAGTSLPRLRRVGAGALEAAVSSVPSFVRLPTGGPLSFTRLADLMAVFLILLGAYWAWRVARRRRAG